MPYRAGLALPLGLSHWTKSSPSTDALLVLVELYASVRSVPVGTPLRYRDHS